MYTKRLREWREESARGENQLQVDTKWLNRSRATRTGLHGVSSIFRVSIRLVSIGALLYPVMKLLGPFATDSFGSIPKSCFTTDFPKHVFCCSEKY